MIRRCCLECGTVVDSGEATLVRGALTLDRALRRATWRGHSVRLAPQQIDILEMIVQREGRCVQRWAFFAGALDEDAAENQLDVQITRIRAAFRAVDPEFDSLLTVRGEGFMWRRFETMAETH